MEPAVPLVVTCHLRSSSTVTEAASQMAVCSLYSTLLLTRAHRALVKSSALKGIGGWYLGRKPAREMLLWSGLDREDPLLALKLESGICFSTKRQPRHVFSYTAEISGWGYITHLQDSMAKDQELNWPTCILVYVLLCVLCVLLQTLLCYLTTLRFLLCNYRLYF